MSVNPFDLPNGNLAYWVARHARLQPDRLSIAYWHSEQACERWTYGALDLAARRLAGWMRERGIGTGDRVAFHDLNDVRFVITMFAVAYVGAIYVPLNFRLAAPELTQMLEDCEAKLVIHGAQLAEHLAAMRERLPGLQALCSDRDGDDVFGAIVDDVHQTEATLATLEWGDTAWLLYTSGSTGRPKGVMLSHGSLFWNTLNTLLIQGGLPSDRILISAPLFHAAPVSSLLEAFLRGATIHLERSFDAERLLARIEHEGIDIVAGVPAMYALIAASRRFDTADFARLRGIIVGGSPVPESLIERYRSRGVTVIQRYGLTEAAPLVTGLAPDAPVEKALTAGLPGFFVDMRIAGADDKGIGEIQARGPNVMQGYWQRDDDTAAAFDEGWLRTGDLGSVDADGYLSVVGRSKDMIISGGENVYAAEVEARLTETPGVFEAAVIGVPHDKWGETVWAIVAREAGSAISGADIMSHLQGRLARYKQPSRVIILDALPKNGAGKIDKLSLRKAYVSRGG